MLPRVLRALQTELAGLQWACTVHENVASADRAYAEAKIPHDLATAVSAAVDAGHAAAAIDMLRAARSTPPATGRGLWEAALSAAEARVAGFATSGAGIEATTPRGSWPPPQPTAPRIALRPGERADGPTDFVSPPQTDWATQSAPTMSRNWPPPASPAGTWPGPATPAWPGPGNPEIGRTIVAHLVLWGGLLLAVLATTRSHYLARGLFHFGLPGDASLHISALAGPRVGIVAITLVPYLVATAIVARTPQRWLIGFGAALLAGVVDYVFWYSSSSAVWTLALSVVLTLFAGWLGVRGRPATAYLLLVPAAVLAGLFYAPHGTGPWLREVPVRGTWSLYPDVLWGFLPFAAAGVVGLFAVAVRTRSAEPESNQVAALALGSLAAAALVAGVVAQAAFVPAGPDYTSYDAGGRAGPADRPGMDAAAAQSTADDAFAAMSDGGYVRTCDGSQPSLAIEHYTIDEVSPQSSGEFYVSADVTLTDGSTATVSVLIGSDAAGAGCLESDSLQETVTSTAPVSSPTPIAPPPTTTSPPIRRPVHIAAPPDTPSLPHRYDPVPTNASPPAAPTLSRVVPYTDADARPDRRQMVEYEPSGLGRDERLAVGDVISFLVHINQQRFVAAWDDSTETLVAAKPDAQFRTGYATSRHYQVAFGQPERVAGDLIVVPARFVSRQDPAAQNYPVGVTDCTVWPQYVFLVVRVDGRWLDDVANKYSDRSVLNRFKRPDGQGNLSLHPLNQRSPC